MDTTLSRDELLVKVLDCSINKTMESAMIDNSTIVRRRLVTIGRPLLTLCLIPCISQELVGLVRPWSRLACQLASLLG